MITKKFTFSDTRHKGINDSNLVIQDEVLSIYPNADISEKDTSGLTVNINGNKVDFYRKAFKCHIHKNNQWIDMDKSDLFRVAVIKNVKRFFGKTEKTKTKEEIKMISENNVQSVIDHIQRKIEFMQNNNGSNSNIAMLKSLNEEIKQYL